jgi:hypothetical protein
VNECKTLLSGALSGALSRANTVAAGMASGAAGSRPGTAGRGLRSFTFQLNLSRI